MERQHVCGGGAARGGAQADHLQAGHHGARGEVPEGGVQHAGLQHAERSGETGIQVLSFVVLPPGVRFENFRTKAYFQKKEKKLFKKVTEIYQNLRRPSTIVTCFFWNRFEVF